MLTLPRSAVADGTVASFGARMPLQGAAVLPLAESNRSSTYSVADNNGYNDGAGSGTASSSSSSFGHSGRMDKVSRLEKYKGLPESLEEGVCNLPLELDLMACPPAFREQLESEAYTLLDLTKLLERSSLPLFLRIHETKAATTHALLLTVPAGTRRLPRVARSALKLGWPRVTTIKIIANITSLDEELDYKIWMPRDYERYFPNLGAISYVAYNTQSGYFREMRHTMGRQQPKSVVFRASQRHMDVLNLSSRLMRYMAHANFLLTSLSITINNEPNYPDYVFTVIRTVLLTDLAAPTNLRLNVDSTDLLYKITDNMTLHFISAYPDEESAGSCADELVFCKPSVRELTLRFREIGKLGIPFAARHFPNLKRLVLNTHADVGHPSLENTLYGCMFLERWQQLSRLQLAHINDILVQLLASSCPQLSELIVFNSATHEELMANNSFDIHRNLIPLPSMPSMRFTPKSLHYLLTRLPLLRVLDLNYPLYVDPLTKTQDIDFSLASSLLKATESPNSQHPRHLRYLSIPFIPLSVHGISGILSAFQSLSTLEVRLAATPRPASSSRRKLLSRVKEAIPRQTYEGRGGSRRPAELSSLWIWSDWSSATSTLSQIMDLFAQSPRLPRVYVPYISGINSQSEVETRLIMQLMKKEMPAVRVHRFEYNVNDYYM
ncbi:hypothetical protein GGI04_002865 [Coemansia thaxteri]|uniref:Uncharacterized protein n=1 Tax=Coemansia thaxteri TaxID=2663907 RepID=A0A9W8BCK5_9FUNG|nr:hypothetical protein H4R26_003669 [Coemansia thaxteri]KAJ2003719.1 hypothetical protein GGI04_002865 [Coemansia thaxteri]KAJ2471365.1 hypothetical protein GGI02_002320 [Coemansia sp. RSA 2322]KAJ2482026.1 hypothetical protein EV174_003321 [Coemansia sp. RSA 2320]